MSYGYFAEHYDRLMEDVDYPARARYIDSLIKARKPDAESLVDLACGTGSMTLELANMGYSAMGVDMSEEMLSKAVQKASGRVLFVRGRLEELELHSPCDAFVCTLDSLNHIDSRDNLCRAFERISLFMKPDSVFVFDMNTCYKHEKILGDNAFVFEYDDLYCVWQNFYEGEGRVDIALDFFAEQADGRYRRYCEEFCELAYPIDDVERMLCGAGLKLLAVYDDMTLDSPADDSERVVFVAGKN